MECVDSGGEDYYGRHCRWVVDRAPVAATAAIRHEALRYAYEETDGIGSKLIAPPSYADDASGDARE